MRNRVYATVGRPSVRLFVWPIRLPHAVAVGLLLSARRPGDVDWLLHGRGGAAASSSRAAARRSAAMRGVPSCQRNTDMFSKPFTWKARTDHDIGNTNQHCTLQKSSPMADELYACCVHVKHVATELVAIVRIAAAWRPCCVLLVTSGRHED